MEKAFTEVTYHLCGEYAETCHAGSQSLTYMIGFMPHVSLE
jgi:hypothetical protein